MNLLLFMIFFLFKIASNCLLFCLNQIFRIDFIIVFFPQSSPCVFVYTFSASDCVTHAQHHRPNLIKNLLRFTELFRGGIPVVPVKSKVLSALYSALPFQHCSFTTPLFIHNQCGQYRGVLGAVSIL